MTMTEEGECGVCDVCHEENELVERCEHFSRAVCLCCSADGELPFFNGICLYCILENDTSHPPDLKRKAVDGLSKRCPPYCLRYDELQTWLPLAFELGVKDRKEGRKTVINRRFYDREAQNETLIRLNYLLGYDPDNAHH
jgi:hypothetical protein